MKKLKVIKTFKDKLTSIVRHKDSEFEAGNERANELIANGFAEFIGIDAIGVSGTVAADEVVNESYVPQVKPDTAKKATKPKKPTADKK